MASFQHLSQTHIVKKILKKGYECVHGQKAKSN